MNPSESLALLLVGLGSALGGVLRFELGRRLAARLGDAFPWATLAVNLSGCLAAGVAAGLVVDDALRLLVLSGLLGGFTTVSTFGLEALLLVRRGRARQAGAYVAVSLAGGLLAAWLGLWIGRA